MLDPKRVLDTDPKPTEEYDPDPKKIVPYLQHWNLTAVLQRIYKINPAI